jgi:DNA-binding transcriptional regulator PaaX
VKKYSRGELTKIVLKTIALSAVVVTVTALPGLAVGLSLFVPKNKQESYKIHRTVHRLQNKKLVEISKTNRVHITPEGRRLLYKYQCDELIIKKPKKWDWLWRIVAFDIPESKRGGRAALQHKLKQLGFYPLQKSMLVYPYDCKKEIEFISNYFGVQEHIIFLLATRIENGSKLKTFFKLS